MYVPLGVRTSYSLLYGTRMPEELVRAAKQAGYDSLALADRNNLYGVHPFLEACREEGIRPLIGATVEHQGREAILLVKSREGFSNLCRLLTCRMRKESTFHLAEAIPSYSSGTVVLTDDVSLLEQWKGTIPDLYARLRWVNRSLIQNALNLQIPLAAAPEVLFLEREDEAVHRVLQAIQKKKPLGSTEIMRMNLARSDRTYSQNSQNSSVLDNREPRILEPAHTVEQRFSSVHEAILHTRQISEACNFQEIFQGFIFPPLVNDPEGDPSSNALSSSLRLRERVLRGAEERYGEVGEGVLDRIEYELSVIEQKGFSEYFLVVADIVQRSSRTCGRGSAAASIVSYCLGITNVDPIRHNLYFERFLNLERADPPDIDVDFAWDERDRIIDEVFHRYGEHHCARVCNQVCYRFPSALRDTARVFGLPETEITAFEKSVRRERKRRGSAPSIPSLESPWNEILRIARRITGLPRNLSIHSGGVVITPQPIDSYVPIETAEKGVPLTTWEKDGIEAAGLVKIDLLGNRSLAVIRDALTNIESNGEEVGEGFRDPISDPETQALLAEGRTLGVFYVESPAMRQLQAKTQKGDFEHLVIHSSIIRPAANRYINEYVRRLRGEPYKPIHPVLDKILKETYGILCYQEDVSKAAVVLAGFSTADADGLRKILSKKNKEFRLACYKDQFYTGAIKRSVSKETIDTVWDMILSFEGYSFCKAHSASYAIVSFQSAYLKAHHPAEFMAAVLSNRGGFYTPAAYIGEARRMGLTILKPDVNESRYSYWGSNHSLRIGFVEVKGLRKETAEQILRERKKKKFTNIEDFANRVELIGEDTEALVSAGALDSLSGGLSRPEQLWALLKAAARSNEANKEPDLFGSLPVPPKRPRRIPTPSPKERRKGEFQRLGYLLDGHILTLWEPFPEEFRRIQGADLSSCLNQRVQLIGWPVTGKEVLTREGNPMEFVSFEDETAIFETVLFPPAYRRLAYLLDTPSPFLIKGIVHEDLGAVAIQVEELKPLQHLYSL